MAAKKSKSKKKGPLAALARRVSRLEALTGHKRKKKMTKAQRHERALSHGIGPFFGM